MRAGRLLYMIQYTSLQGGVSKEERCARLRISTAARESLNFRTSRQKLWLILESTFNPQTALYVTLTYRDADLPARKDAADRNLTYWIRRIREERALRGRDTVYVRVTEFGRKNDRLHHHVLINGTGDDYKAFHEAWPYGDQVEILPYYCKTHWLHAEYFTKEPKVPGRRRVGERMWRTSRNVTRPVITYSEAPAGSTLRAPVEAHVVDSDTKFNTFGRFQYIEAHLPLDQTIE